MKHIFTIILMLFLIFSNQSLLLAKGNISKNKNGITVKVDSQNIQIQVLGEKIIRVVSTLSGGALEHESLMIVNPKPETEKWSVKEEKDFLILATQFLQAKVDLSNGNIQFLDATGKTLLIENGREIIPANVIDEETFNVRQKFTLQPDEALYGLGQHQEGNMNLRGKTVALYQFNWKVAVPVLVSSKNYGILWDNNSLSKFTDNSDGMELWSEVGDGIDYYFIAGNNLDEVISGYRKLTGQTPLYPKWAYGFFQSKERYNSQQEVVSIVDEFRRRQVPLDVIVQDWRYWDPREWGSHYMDRQRFPDPLKYTKDIHDKNAKIIISIWGKFAPGSPNYYELEKNGFLWESTAWEPGRYYNAYDPGAQAMYWKQIRDSLFAKNFDGWWLDATEPETGDLRNDDTKRLMNNNLGTGARYLNAYTLMTTKAVYEGQRQETSDKRVYILTRSAFPGQQRYAATTWSGDITASWEVFHTQIKAGLNFCYTGIPYWTTDGGAYTVPVQNGYKSEMYRELFTRWYQYAAFCPIFRVHGSSTPREIWRFGDEGHWSYDTQLKFDHLRYRLMPYIYSLGWKVTNDGYTIMRGLAFDYADDPKVYNIDDQYLFGSSILVNPVIKSMYHPWVEEDAGNTIPSEYLRDLDGNQGLSGEYFEGMNFDKYFSKRTDKQIDFDWGDNTPFDGLVADSFSVRWTGKLIAPESGEYSIKTRSDDGAKLYINDQLFLDRWQDQAPLIESGNIFLEAGKEYNVKYEFYDKYMGAVSQLRWILPSEQKIVDVKLPEKTRKVYLPGSLDWYDFWTGKIFSGGQTIVADAPIDIMPLFVKAGAIIPMGPFLQYSTEKPADPIELRVYTGADGEFELYEDENDNYNYEKGIYATIPIKWNESNKTLTVGKRQGSFPGMLEQRTFRIVLVDENHGIGVEPEKNPDQVVVYNGEQVDVQLQ